MNEYRLTDKLTLKVIAYILVCGEPPFSGQNPKAILKEITAKDKKLKFATYDLTDSYKDFGLFTLSLTLCST